MEQNEKANRAIHDGEEVQKIWSWGAGTDGQLGTGKLEDELLPQLLHLPSLTSSGPISLLACGGAHVIALSSGATFFLFLLLQKKEKKSLLSLRNIFFLFL